MGILDIAAKQLGLRRRKRNGQICLVSGRQVADFRIWSGKSLPERLYPCFAYRKRSRTALPGAGKLHGQTHKGPAGILSQQVLLVSGTVFAAQKKLFQRYHSVML